MIRTNTKPATEKQINFINRLIHQPFMGSAAQWEQVTALGINTEEASEVIDYLLALKDYIYNCPLCYAKEEGERLEKREDELFTKLGIN